MDDIVSHGELLVLEKAVDGAAVMGASGDFVREPGGALLLATDPPAERGV
jgi:hypothetical protein